MGPKANPPHARLPLDHFSRDTATLAEELLGAVVCHRVDNDVLRATIVETEAYVGTHDQASHSRMGPTKRNAVMFGPPGHVYVFLVYGMHHCVNVVTEPDGSACAILIRGVKLLGADPRRIDGPGRVCRALGIDLRLNGVSLDGEDIWIEEGAAPRRVERTPRIGVTYAGDWAGAPLRFVVPRGAEEWS